jgi:hypothetical protein
VHWRPRRRVCEGLKEQPPEGGAGRESESGWCEERGKGEGEGRTYHRDTWDGGRHGGKGGGTGGWGREGRLLEQSPELDFGLTTAGILRRQLLIGLNGGEEEGVREGRGHTL